MITPKVNQTYVIPNGRDGVLRRNRILAPHPDGGYLVESQLFMGTVSSPYITRVATTNLDRAFQLEYDVCEHKGLLLDFYEDGKDHPTYYECFQCHDRFPMIGDTSLWFPKVLDAVNSRAD